MVSSIPAPDLSSSDSSLQSVHSPPPPAKVRLGVLTIYSPLHNEHVAFGALGVGKVPFLQDHNCVPHVAVQKIIPEFVPVHCSSQTPLHRAPTSFQHFWEGYVIDLGLTGGGWGSAPPAPPITYCVLSRGATEATPRLAPLHTPGTAPTASASPGILV